MTKTSWMAKAIAECEKLAEKAPFFVMFGLDFGLIEFGRWYMETGKGGYDPEQARYFAEHRKGPEREFLARIVTRRVLDDPLTDDLYDQRVLDAVAAGFTLGHNELMNHTGWLGFHPNHAVKTLEERLQFLDLYRSVVVKAIERAKTGYPEEMLLMADSPAARVEVVETEKS